MSNKKQIIKIAKQVLETEIQGLRALSNSIDHNFTEVVDTLLNTKGKIILSGIGKSGYIARKISSSLASIGFPSFFVHPAEAGHGDLGMIDKNDTVVLISNSGESIELKNIIDYCISSKVIIIGITRSKSSTLERSSDISVILPDTPEASDINMPTTSTTMTLAFGDALVIAMQKSAYLTKDDYKKYHPAGKIGKDLLQIKDLMYSNDKMPKINFKSSCMEAVMEIAEKRLGCVIVIDDQDKMLGIITDGDIRRHVNVDFKKTEAAEIMSINPKTINESASLNEALELMESYNITQLIVVKNKKPIGVLHIHDLVKLYLN